MFTLIGLFFILLLSMILYLLYKNEFTAIKNGRHHAKVEEYWAGRERRKYTRFKKTLDVVYEVGKKPRSNGNGHTLDISEGGMKLLLEEKLPKGTPMNLKVSIPGSSGELEAGVEIVWCEEAKRDDASGKRFFYHGVKFLPLGEPSEKRLSDYIHSIAAQS